MNNRSGSAVAHVTTRRQPMIERVQANELVRFYLSLHSDEGGVTCVAP
jgi:hypothetical protein